MLEDADRANQAMVDRLIAQGALWSPLLIKAFRATRRDSFLDRIFQYQGQGKDWRETITRDPGPEQLPLIYADQALTTHLSDSGPGRPPVPDSSSSQPSLMAQMLEDLKLRRGLKVLEVGAGTGYNAALIAHVVGPELVTSIDVNLEVLSEAWDHLRSYPERGVRLLHGDGRSGYRPSAPYDRIIVTAATPDLEPAWLAELRSGGLLVAPLELAPGLAFVVRGRATGGQFDGRLCRAAYFMPLRAAENEDDGELSVPPADIDTLSVPAPWSAWLERKRLRSSLAGIAPAFAFFAFLHRFRVSHQAAFGNGAIFGIGEGAERCWLGSPQWRCASAGARDLALDLWREFLNLGAPRPIEYRVHFAPFDLPEVPGTFSRLGPKFAQRWELPSPRERLAWP